MKRRRLRDMTDDPFVQSLFKELEDITEARKTLERFCEKLKQDGIIRPESSVSSDTIH